MNIIEKYAYYKKGIIKQASEKEQLFFKTCPTDEQINLLNDINKTNTLLWNIVLICYLILGGILGFALAYYQYIVIPIIKGALGVQ